MTAVRQKASICPPDVQWKMLIQDLGDDTSRNQDLQLGCWTRWGIVLDVILMRIRMPGGKLNWSRHHSHCRIWFDVHSINLLLSIWLSRKYWLELSKPLFRLRSPTNHSEYLCTTLLYSLICSFIPWPWEGTVHVAKSTWSKHIVMQRKFETPRRGKPYNDCRTPVPYLTPQFALQGAS